MAGVQDEFTVLPNKARLYKQAGSARFYVAIKLDNGRWERKSTGTADLAEAKEKATALYYEAQALAAHNLPQATRTFSSVAKSVVAELESKKDTADWKQVYKHYIGAIKRYQIPYFRNTRLDNVKDKYRGYQSYVAEQLGHAPSSSTLTNHNCALKLVFDKAIQRGYMTQLNVPKLDTKGKQSQRRPTFELSEYRSLITKLHHWSKAGAHRDRDAEIKLLLVDYVLILANTGIRHGREAMDLKWQNLSFKKSNNGTPLVVFRVLKKKGRTGAHQWRDVVMRNRHNNAINILNRLKDRQEALKGYTVEQLVKQRNDAYIFALSDGTQPKQMASTFKKFLKAKGLLLGDEGTARTLYSWRHFYATVELTRKHPINVALLARQMGTRIQMIEKHYGHLDVIKNGDALSGRMDWDEKNDKKKDGAIVDNEERKQGDSA